MIPPFSDARKDAGQRRGRQGCAQGMHHPPLTVPLPGNAAATVAQARRKWASSQLLWPACPPCSANTAQSKCWSSRCNHLQGGTLEAGQGCASFFTARPAPAAATFKAQLMDAHTASALREQMPAPQDVTRTTKASDKTKAMPSGGALEEHCRALQPPPLQSQGQQP